MNKTMKKTVLCAAVCCAFAAAFARPFAFGPWTRRPIRPPRPRPPHPPIDLRVEPKEVKLYVFAPPSTNGVYCVECSEDMETWAPCTNVVNGAKCFFRVTEAK